MRTISKKLSRKLATTGQEDMTPQVMDVAVTDPTSGLGVVLRYDPETMEAPIVVEKVNGLEVHDLADQGLQIVESQVLAQVLFDNCDIGHAIPADLHSEVGELLALASLLNIAVAEMKDELKRGLGQPHSNYGHTHESHPSWPPLTNPAIRVSLD